MIIKMRRQFIAIAMGSMLFITIVVISAINLTGYYTTMQNADSMLQMLSENDGMIPSAIKNNLGPIRDNFVPSDNTTDKEDMTPPEGFMPDNTKYAGQINAETQYKTRYFSVSYNENGEISNINMTHVAAIDEETAVSYANEVTEKAQKGTFGNKDIYRFLYDTDGTIFFLDCEQEITGIKTLLRNSCLVGLLSLITEFIFIVIMSKKITKPVEKSIESQKRFITDASHEIKTPLAIISANTEVIEMTEGKSEWSESILNQTKRLNKLVMNLIELSKMDEEKPPIEKQDFSISDAVFDTAKGFSTLAEKNGKNMNIIIEEGITFHGDEGSIRELVSILIDNAIKYSTKEGTIEVHLSGKKKIELKVSNPYSHSEGENPEKMFERFYRVDTSRSRETGGFGIGLSIAKAIVEAHKGRISAKEEPKGTMSIQVEFKTA